MRVRDFFLLSSTVGLTTGCPGTSEAPHETPPVATCANPAAPAASPLGGDANGDGAVDVSDGVYLARSILASGPAPVCAAAMDLVPDGDMNLGDVPAVWYAIGPRTAPYLPPVTTEDCPAVARTAEPPCGDGLALAVSAPAEVDGPDGVDTPFDATVTLTAPTQAIEAWSFTVVAEGCTIAASTTAGTLAADVADGTGGLRGDGMAWQVATGAEARALTVLDWRTQAALPTGGPTAIHSLTVHGAPTAACAPCTLTVVPGDATTGVESVVTTGGWRYLPELGATTVKLCAK